MQMDQRATQGPHALARALLHWQPVTGEETETL